MTDSEKTVFISYRRDSSRYVARIVFQDLREHDYDVFRDIERIDSGKFSQIILNEIAARTHFILILSHGTLERCAQPDDWVRREIEEAIKLDRNIVPMFFDGFTFQDATPFLTGSLAKLADYNALTIPQDDQFLDAAMDILRDRFLKMPDYTVPIRPVSTQEAKIAQEIITEAAKEPQPTSQELNAEVHFSRGIARSAMGDYPGAIAQYTAAIKLNPSYHKIFYNRGLAYQQTGEPEKALADYAESLRIDPNYLKPLINRAIIHYEKSDFGQSLTDCNQVITKNPSYAKAYYNRALVHLKLKQPSEAINDFKQYLVLAGNKAENRAKIEETIAVLEQHAQPPVQNSGMMTGILNLKRFFSNTAHKTDED